MISEKFRCIFIHIPKNAGTSIESKICFEEGTENLLPNHRTTLDLEPLSTIKLFFAQYGLSKIINIAGTIPHPQLKPRFDAANIGVSYVPLTDYYDCQPVTKTFEYLLPGMPVVATLTSENRNVIHSENGVLVGDTTEDFYKGMKAIFEKKREEIDVQKDVQLLKLYSIHHKKAQCI